MIRRIAPFRLIAAAVLGAVAMPAAAQGRVALPSAADSTDPVAAAVNAQMSGGPFFARGHIALSPLRRAAPGDSARAAAVADALRRALARYRSVDAARADGFQIFAPDVPGQQVYHFVHYAWAMANETSWNPSKPSALLYRKRGTDWVLEGAMYTAPAGATLADLDRRVPLSMARWHRHVNFCLPRAGERHRWSERRNGRPVFGPEGVATREACEAAGGRFVPQLFGWMLHASPFASDDPRVIFGDGGEGGGHHHGH